MQGLMMFYLFLIKVSVLETIGTMDYLSQMKEYLLLQATSVNSAIRPILRKPTPMGTG